MSTSFTPQPWQSFAANQYYANTNQASFFQHQFTANQSCQDLNRQNSNTGYNFNHEYDNGSNYYY